MPQEAWKQDSRARPLTIPPQLRRVFRAVVSTVVPEAVNLDEPRWVELERVVEETLGARPRNPPWARR
jgi:hypothetical protein